MADDRHYVPGDFYRICDLTGFKVRANRTKKQWNNYIVREQSFEVRQPQDFVRGVRDDQSVPEPRSRQQNVFLQADTTITGPSSTYIPALGYSVTYPPDTLAFFVDDISIFSVGDKVALMQDDGTLLWAHVRSIHLLGQAFSPYWGPGVGPDFGPDFSPDFAIDFSQIPNFLVLTRRSTSNVSIGNLINNITYAQQQASQFPASR